MKRLPILLAMMLTTMAVAAQKSVFIYAGQSNADGREFTQNLPDYMTDNGSLPSSPYTYLKWASICGNPSKKTFGTRTFYSGERYAFCDVANYWIDQASSQNFYAIKCAYGGTAIAPGVTADKLPIWYADAEWMQTHFAYKGDDITKEEFKNYNSLTKNLTEGFASLVEGTLAAIEEGYDVKAIMWHQGESDRNASASYYTNFKTMIAFMRNAIYQVTGDESDLTLPFIFGTVCRRSTQYSADVEQAQRQVASEDPDVYLIDMQNATLKDDNLHFDKRATEYLGKKMYNQLVSLGLVNGSEVEVEEFPQQQSPMDNVDVPSPDNRSWNFTAISQNTLDKLEANKSLTEGASWNWQSGWSYRYGKQLEVEQLTIDSYVIPETKGLFFTSAQVNRVTMGSTYLGMRTSDATLFIPKLTAGQIITFTLKAASKGSVVNVNPNMDSQSLVEVIGSNSVGNEGGTVTYRVRYNVTIPTHMGFTMGGSYVQSIRISTPETVNVLIGADQKETFAFDRPLDFSPFTDLFKAYVVTGYNDETGKVDCEQVLQVPANTGVLLMGEESTVNVPIIEGAAPEAPAVNLLTAVVEEGSAPAGSFVLTTSGGDTRFTKTANETSLVRQAYIEASALGTNDAYDFNIVIHQDPCATPTATVGFESVGQEYFKAAATLSTETSADIIYYYKGGSTEDWTAIEGNIFRPEEKADFQIIATAEGYADSEPLTLSLAGLYELKTIADLTTDKAFNAATKDTNGFNWSTTNNVKITDMPSDQVFGRISSASAISGLSLQNNNLDARYSFAKGYGLACNYGYWVKTTGAPTGAYAEYEVYTTNSSITTPTQKILVANPNNTEYNFKPIKAVRLYEPTDVFTGIKLTPNSTSQTPQYYSISGQLVARPTKGIYIVEGKKVLFK